MQKFRLPKSSATALSILFLVLLIALPRNPKFNYDYKKGSPWSYETLISQFDFPILKTEEQLQEQKAASYTVPYYKFSEEVVAENMKKAEALDIGSQALKSKAIAVMDELYSKGIVSDEGVKVDKNAVSEAADVLYIQRNKRAQKFPSTEVYREAEARDRLLSAVSAAVKDVNVDSVLRESGAYELIVPNLLYDKQTTQLVHAEATEAVSPTQGFVSSGELIVSQGEIVTEEIAQLLDSYKAEYEASVGSSGPGVLRWTGNAILVLALLVALCLSIYFTSPSLFSEFNRFAYLLFIFALASLMALSVRKINPQLLYLMPFTLPAVYLTAFFRNKVIVPICILSLFPLLIVAHDGVVLFVMFAVAQLVCMFSIQYFGRVWKQFINAGIVFLTLTAVYFGFRLIDMVNGNVYLSLAYLFIGSFLLVLGYPLIYLFEKMFNLVSNSRLEELCDTNNKLLHKLESTAPGTFQHSIQVMNMADAAARAIGANVQLVRAGALYHDIGKMENPNCFIENESLIPGQSGTYHGCLSPKESAHDIIRHVDDGLALAEKYRLPQVIREFIATHHGTAVTGYFYNKYVNAGGDPADKADFTYHGHKPQTREQMILMLCDTIEAASRTLKEHSPESYAAFVEKMVSSKVDDGQLEENEMSIKELNIVKEVLVGYLNQVYHGRVAYPKRRNNIKNQ